MSRFRAWLWPALGVVAVSAAMLPMRARLDKVHVALAFLLLVLVASAWGGRRIGVASAVVSFLAFNFLFLPPYNTFEIADPLDWFVLFAFLATGIVAAELLHRAQREADLARTRAEEILRLSAEADHAAALREADRMKDALLASVSHDLRTPLTTIRANAQQLLDEGGDERAAAIAEEADRLNGMVQDLLDLSRISAGAIRPDIAINAAEDVMGAALQRISGVAIGREVRASLDPTDPVLVGRFDFSATLRILANLLDNALKYSPSDTPVEFQVRREGSELRFDVRDRGDGVPESMRARLFSPFARAGAGDGRGTGLGLAIAAGLAAAQAGRVTYAPRDGGGSVFSLWVPAADPIEV